MPDFFAIEFPLAREADASVAWREVAAILQAGHCPMPCAYRDAEQGALLLVWRYERPLNELAWRGCHHVQHMLLYEMMPAMTRFYNEYKTEPVMYSSEYTWRVLRFGLPHGFMCYGEVPLDMEGLERLHECEWDAPTFRHSVCALLERTLEICMRAEVTLWDNALLYSTCKRIEAMAITTGRFDDAVEEAMSRLNDAISEAC